jgi:hypothetical protein
MTSRILDSLAATLTGMLIGVLLMAVATSGQGYFDNPRPTPRSSQHADPRPGTRGMTTERVSPLPSPDVAGGTGRPNAPPAPTIGTRAASAPEPRTSLNLRGIATWFRSPAGVSAAGPALRDALGPTWRNTAVRVCGDRCAVTVLGDWMRADRLIDLHAPVFAAVCGPLSRGVCRVTVTAIPAPPDTAKGDTP